VVLMKIQIIRQPILVILVVFLMLVLMLASCALTLRACKNFCVKLISNLEIALRPQWRIYLKQASSYEAA